MFESSVEDPVPSLEIVLRLTNSRYVDLTENTPELSQPQAQKSSWKDLGLGILKIAVASAGEKCAALSPHPID